MTANESIETRKEADPFVAPFDSWEKGREQKEPAWVGSLRKGGIAQFAETGLPDLRWEDWRFTNIDPIRNLPFHPALTGGQPAPSDALSQWPLQKIAGDRLVFIDGHLAPSLSSVRSNLPGFVAVSLAEALTNHGPLLEKNLGRSLRAEGKPFAALNAAYFTDGAFIVVPAHTTLSVPIHLVYFSTGAPNANAVHARNLVTLGEGARAVITESYLSLGEAPALTNTAFELVVADGARLEHVRLQDQNRRSLFVASWHGELGRSSNVFSHSFALGGRLSRCNLHARLAGEGLECVLNGLYLASDDQLADHYMIVEHASPRCASHEYFNGVLKDRARGVFHGRIYVHQAAQKTDAKQTNKNVLLSDDAVAHTKPQLEIYADDVKCTHGATIGRLDRDAIFYLQARGIPETLARQMLIHAFAGEIVDRVQSEPLRKELNDLVWRRLQQATAVGIQ